MSAIIGQEFLEAFQDQIGLTAAEMAALAFFRSDFSSLEADILSQFFAIRDIELNSGFFQGLVTDSIDVSEMAYQYEVGSQVLEHWKLASSAFMKILEYMTDNFDYDVVRAPDGFSAAAQARALANNPALTTSDLFAAFGEGLLQGVDSVLLGVPTAIAISRLTFLRAADVTADLFDAFVDSPIPNLIGIGDMPANQIILADKLFQATPILYKLAKDIIPAIWDMATGADPDARNLTGILKTASNDIGILSDIASELKFLDSSAGVIFKFLKFTDTLVDILALISVSEGSSDDASYVVNTTINSLTAEMIGDLSGLVKAISDFIPGVDGTFAENLIELGDAIADSLSGTYSQSRFQQLDLSRPQAEEIYQTSSDLFSIFQLFLASVDAQIGMTDGVAEALVPNDDAPAPEFVTVSDVRESDTDGSGVEIDVIDTGHVQLEIIGGLDANLFLIADGRVVFASEEARLTPDADGNGVYDILIQATNASGVSSQQAFRIRVTEQPVDDPAETFVDVIGIAAAETVEGDDLAFLIHLSDAAPRDVTLSYRIDLGDAESADINFAALTGTITISEGNQVGVLTLPTEIDVDSASETLTVTLTDAFGGAVLTGGITAVGTINDAVGAPDLIVADVAIDRSTIDHDGFAILTISVQNIGDALATASSLLISLTDDSGQTVNLGNVVIGELDAGTSQTLTVRVARGEANSVGVDAAFEIPDGISSGQIEFAVTADALNTIFERSGSNNSQSLNGIELAASPSTGAPDLVVSNFELVSSNVQPGELVTFNWTVTNTGDDLAVSASHGLFISSTTNVTADDQRLQVIHTNDLAPGESQSGQTTAFISPTTDTGGYNLALIADVPFNGSPSQVDESDEANNSSSIASLLVGNAPNVGGFGLTFSTTEFTPGGRVTATLQVTNDSLSSSFAGTARFVLSDDPTIGADDENLTFITIPELDPGESRQLTVTFFVPENTRPGPYYAGVFLEDVPGDTNPLDNSLAPVQVNVPAAPESADGRDLTFGSFDWGVPSAELGGAPLSISYSVINQGDAETFNGGAVRFYASADNVYSENDVYLNAFSFLQIDAGESQDFNINLALNANVGVGDVYIIAVIDPGPGRRNFGVLEPNDDDMSNNSLAQLITVTPTGDAPPDGELVPAWVDGAPASGTWTYDIFGRYGTRYDIDWDGGIRNGLGEEIRGDGGFGRDAYRWQGFAPEAAYYDQNGRGLIFEGVVGDLDAVREVFVTPEGGEFVRFLDTVTNNTNSSVEYTFAYTLSIDLIRGSIVSFYDDISGNPEETISNIHTFIAGFSSDNNGSVLGPSWSWSVGERDYFVSDTFERSAIGDRFFLETTTITLEPGESASFLHFGDHSSRIDNGSSGNWTSPFRDDDFYIDIEFNNGRLEGLTPEDIQHVINFDVEHLIRPADLSLDNVVVEITEAGTLIYEVDVTNLGSFDSQEASLEIMLTNTETGVSTSASLALITALGRSQNQSLFGVFDPAQTVEDGNYTAQLRLVHPSSSGDAGITNDIFAIVDELSVRLFTDGDDIVSLPTPGVFDAGAGNDRVVGTEGIDEVSGGAGSDVIFGRGGNDFIDDGSSSGGTESNYFYGEAGNDTLTGNAGRDLLDGGVGNDSLFGEGGNDELRGRAGIDTLLGGAGDDILEGGSEADFINGGEGRDRADFISSEEGVFVSLASGEAYGGHAEGDLLLGIEDIGGSGRRDVLIGDVGANRLFGRSGDDLLSGGLGADDIDGGDGIDFADYRGSAEGVQISLSGDAGVGGDAAGDRLFGVEGLYGSNYGDVLVGGFGDDIIEAGDGDDRLFGREGADRLDGGLGQDTADYLTSLSPISISLLTGRGFSGEALGDTLFNIENIAGSFWDDVVIGNGANNLLEGRQGNDTLYGGQGADLLFGGSGNDYLNGDDGNDLLDGGLGNDSLFGGLGDDIVYAGSGNDTLDGGSGNDTVIFEDTNRIVVRLSTQTVDTGDTISDFENVTTGAGNDALIGSDVANILSSGNGDDYIDGLEGDDVLNGGAGNDRLFGRDGNDTLSGGFGNDMLYGGDGNDTVVFNEANRVVVRLNTQTVDNGDTISGFENATTGAGNDALIGSSVTNILTSGVGDDYIDGLGGDDVLNGGAGNDRLVGGEGNDFLFGGAGADMLAGGVGNDTLDGGDGNDTVVFNEADRVVVRLSTQTVDTGDIIIGFENATTGVGDDALIGSDVANILTAGAGDDYLDGLGGNDVLNGGKGNDRLFGRDGDDTLAGGDGDDTLDGGDGNDTVVFDDVDRIVVRLNTQTVSTGDIITGFENATSGVGNDALIGSNASNTLTAGAGDDYIDGLGGDDVLIGGMGNDRLIGGLGADLLLGGAGDDRIVLDANDIRLDNGQAIDLGGSGRDTLVMAQGSTFVTGGP